jgi:hypothetical protein
LAERKSYLLRIDPAVWAEIERLAQAELRSVNGQVEYLLREALERRGIPGRHAAGSGSPGGLTRRNPRQRSKS